MAARNRCRVVQYGAALILVPFSMKSTMWSQNTIYRQISHPELFGLRGTG